MVFFLAVSAVEDLLCSSCLVFGPVALASTASEGAAQV